MGVVATQAYDERHLLYCGSVYPNLKAYTEPGDTALCLFCAEWLGLQDAYWVAEAGLVGTCVDLQGHKLAQMNTMYPVGWEFIEGDAYEFVENTDRRWDVVTLDPWTGQFERCANLIDTWTTLARKVVVLGHGNYRLSAPVAPEGWTLAQTIKRSDYKGGVNWLVYTRD